MPNTITYNADGKTYSIPDTEKDDFLKDFPKAEPVNLYEAEGKKYGIPDKDTSDFQKDFPDAKLLAERQRDDPYSEENQFGKEVLEGQKPAIRYNQVKTLKQQINNGAPTTQEKEQQEQDKQKAQDIIITNAYHNKSSKPLTNAGDAQYNDNGTVSFLDENGNLKIISSTDVDKSLYQKQEKMDIARRANGTPVEKAQYAVLDLFSNYIKSIPSDLNAGIKEVGKDIAEGETAASGQHVEDTRNWKDKTLDGLVGTMKIVGSVAKLHPATAAGMALWTGGTEAAQAAVEPFKKSSDDALNNIYHIVNLLTQPATEVRSWFTQQPMTPREQKVYELANNLAFLGEAYLADRGITSFKDIPTTFSPEKKDFIEKANPEIKTDNTVHPDVVQYNDEKIQKLLSITDALKNRKPIQLEDLAILHDVVKNASEQDINNAQLKTQEKIQDEQEKQKDLVAKQAQDRQVGKELYTTKDLLGNKKESWMYLPKPDEVELSKKTTNKPVTGRVWDIKKAELTGKVSDALEKGKISFPAVEKLYERAGLNIPDDIVKNYSAPIEKKQLEPTENENIKNEEKNVGANDNTTEKQDVISNKEEQKSDLPFDNEITPEKDANAPHENYPNLSNSQVSELENTGASPNVIRQANELVKVDPETNIEDIKKVIDETNKSDIDKEYQTSLNFLTPEEYEAHVKQLTEDSPQGNGTTEERPDNTSEVKGTKEAEGTTGQQVIKFGVIPEPVKRLLENIHTGVSRDYNALVKGIKQANISLPEKSDRKVYVNTVLDMAKTLAKKHSLQDYLYDKSNDKIADPVNYKHLLKSQEHVQNTVQEAIKAYGPEPENFKSYLETEAIGHGALSESTEDPNMKLQSQTTFNSLSTISDMVRKGDAGKDDIRWINKILSKQNKVDLNGNLKTAWTIEQMKLLQELGRPNTPIRPEEYQAVESALQPYDTKTNKPLNARDIAEELGKPAIETVKAVKQIDEFVNNLMDFVHYPQFYHRLASTRALQIKFKDLYNSYNSTLNADYQERVTQLERRINPEAINLNWTKKQQDNVSKVMDEGFYKDRQYYTEEELKGKGLSNSEIGLYNHYNDVLNTVKDWFKDGYKAQVGFDDLSPEEQKEAESKFPEWLNSNNGYQHLKREGDFYVAYHGLNDITKEETPQVEFFKTQKEADTRAKELNTTTYEHNGVKKNYAALQFNGTDIGGFKEYERNENKIPTVHEKKEFDIGLAKAVGYDDPDYLYDLAGQIGINQNSDEWKLLNNYIEDLKKKQGYVPSLTFHSNRIPGAPIDFNNKMKSLRDLGSQAAHYRQRRFAENVWNDKTKDLTSLKTKKDQRALLLYKNWKEEMLQKTANKKMFYLISKAYAFTYLGMKPSMIMQQYFKNTLTMPPEMIDRLQQMGMKAGKSDLAMNKYMGLSWAEGHSFGLGKLYPKGVDDFGNKTPKNRFPKDEKGQQRFRLMGRGFDRGGISNMSLDWVTDKDGAMSSQKTARRGWIMGHAPLLTRSWAFNAGLHLGQLAGIKDDDALLRYAEDYLYDTKYRYGKENRPKLLQNKNAFARIFTPFLNTHALYLQWFYRELDNMHKTFYKVAPRVALGGLKAGAPIAGTMLANMMNAYYISHHNAQEKDPDKKLPVNYNMFSKDATDAYSASIEGSKVSPFMKKIILNGAVSAVANSAGVPGDINTNQLVDLGKDYFQDYFTLPNITGFYSNPVTKTFKAIDDAGSAAKDLATGHFYDSKYDFLRFLEDNPLSGVHNAGQAVDWYLHSNKLAGKLYYVPSGNETVQSAMGFTPERLKDYSTAEEANKKYTDDRKTIITNTYSKLNETLDKKGISKIIAYYHNPSRQNAESLYGKDFIENIFKYRNGLKNTVGTLYQNSDLENKGKVKDMGNWRKLDISIDHEDSFQTDKHNPKYSLQTAIKTWLNDYVSKKTLKDNPPLQQFYNDINKESIDKGTMKSAGQLINSK